MSIEKLLDMVKFFNYITIFFWIFFHWWYSVLLEELIFLTDIVVVVFFLQFYCIICSPFSPYIVSCLNMLFFKISFYQLMQKLPGLCEMS